MAATELCENAAHEDSRDNDDIGKNLNLQNTVLKNANQTNYPTDSINAFLQPLVNNEHSFKTVLPIVRETPGKKRCGEEWDQENTTA